MAERSSGPRGQTNRIKGKPQAPQKRSFDMGDFLRGDIPTVEMPPPAPHTTRDLMTRWGSKLDPRLQGIGVVAESIELRPSKKGRTEMRVVVPANSELVRADDKIPAPELQVRNDLREQAPLVEKHGQNRKAIGRFAVDTATILLIGDEAYSFKPSHLKGPAEGMAGGPLTTRPSDEIGHDITDEYVIVAKDKSGKRVLVVPVVGDHYESHDRVLKAKERVIQGLGAELESARRSGADTKVVDALNKRINHLTEVQEVRLVTDKGMGPDLERSARTVVTEINDVHDTTSAFTYLDGESNVLTIARPVRLDLEKAGLDPLTLELYDGTGHNRKKVQVEQGGGTSELLERIVKSRRRGDKVQKRKGGPVKLPATIPPARQIQMGYPVVSSFLN